MSQPLFVRTKSADKLDALHTLRAVRERLNLALAYVRGACFRFRNGKRWTRPTPLMAPAEMSLLHRTPGSVSPLLPRKRGAPRYYREEALVASWHWSFSFSLQPQQRK